MPTAARSDECRREILRTLLTAGGVDLFTIAAEIAEPPFRVRAELRALKRERLVTETIRADLHHWRLTSTGLALAGGRNQLRMV